MSSTKYSGLSNEELVKEIKRRRSAGGTITVDLRSDNDKLVSALELDDVANGTADEQEKEDVKGLSPGFVSNDPLENQVPLQPEMPSSATQPHDDVFKESGLKARHVGDGYTYQIAYIEGEDRPYKARIPKQASGHPGLYWEGNEAEYKACFEKV